MPEERKIIFININKYATLVLKNRNLILINLFINKYHVEYFIICMNNRGVLVPRLRKDMSSSLDKLKALTSRLENKIGEKENLFSGEKTIKAENIIEVDKTVKIDKATEAELKDSDHSFIQSMNIDTSYIDAVRSENILRVKVLHEKLKIFEKSPDFSNIFIYKAMNLSGIGLKEEDFAQVRAGKYIQVIAITYEPDKNGKKKAKNISLGYFGKAETLDVALKNEIIEFVLRWRYEKAFQNLEHYKDLISRVDMSGDTSS